jgi:hypothetical protein
MLGDLPGWVAAAWRKGYGPRLRDQQLAREQWIEALARAWCLIRIRQSLTPQQARDQDDYADRLLGLKFYPTTPYPLVFDGLIRNVQATPIAELFGLYCPDCGGPLEDRLVGPFWCPACQATVSSWTLVVDILAEQDYHHTTLGTGEAVWCSCPIGQDHPTARDPFARTDAHRQRVAELEARGFPGPDDVALACDDCGACVVAGEPHRAGCALAVDR